MANIETRLAKLEQSVPDATVVRTVLLALRRAHASGCLTAEDVTTIKAALNERTLERQFEELTDEELRESIELLRGLRQTTGVVAETESSHG